MIESTQLRSLIAKDVETLELAINRLQFKVELKGSPSPHPDGDGWVVWFVIPDEIKDWMSLDLRKLL